MLDADGLALGVARAGALGPGFGRGDQRARLDEEVARRGSGGGHGHDASGLGSGVRARHVEGVVEHGDDVGVAVVLVEADVAFELAELVGGAVEQTARPIDGRPMRRRTVSSAAST